MPRHAAVAPVPKAPDSLIERRQRRMIYNNINLAICQLQLADEAVDESNPARARACLRDAATAVSAAAALLPTREGGQNRG